MNGIEVEIKLQLAECDYDRIVDILGSIASIKAQKHQTDVYYSPAGESFYDSGDRCLRIRTEDNKTILSYKRIYGENTSTQYIEEYEACVDSFNMMDSILKALGFRNEIVVDKHRQEYVTENGLLVALDCVADLGSFIEIENCNESDDLEKRNQDLYDFVNCLGVDMTNRNSEGYSNMLYRKNRMQGDKT